MPGKLIVMLAVLLLTVGTLVYAVVAKAALLESGTLPVPIATASDDKKNIAWNE